MPIERRRRGRRSSTSPAAMDLVHRYAETFQPQGRGAWGGVVDGPGGRGASAVSGSCTSADHQRTRSTSARGLRVGERVRLGRRWCIDGVSAAMVGADIEQLGPRALLGLADLQRAPSPPGARSAHSGIVEIAGDDRPLGADDHTGRLEPDLHPVRAVVALRGRVGVGVDVECVVRAGLHAGLAADAAVAVEIDDPVGPPVERTVGQIVTHGASSQWLQRGTRKCRRVAGNGPFSTYFTHVRTAPRGTRFSSLHATVQA